MKQSGRDGEKERSPLRSASLANNTKPSPRKSPDKKQLQAVKPTVAAISPDAEGEFSWNVLFDGESSNSPTKTADRQGRRPSSGKSPNKKSRESTAKRSRDSTVKEETATTSVSTDKQTPHKDKVERWGKESGSSMKTGVGCDKAGMQGMTGEGQKEKDAVTDVGETDGSAVCGYKETVEKELTVTDGQSLTVTDGVREEREIQIERTMEGAQKSQKQDVLSDEVKDIHCRSQHSPPINKTNESVPHPKPQLASPLSGSVDTSQLQTVESCAIDSVRDDNTPLEHSFEVDLLPPTSFDSSIDQTTNSEQSVRNSPKVHLGGSLMGHSTVILVEEASHVAEPNETSVAKVG